MTAATIRGERTVGAATPPPAPPETPTATWFAVRGPNGDLTWRVESPAHAVGAKVHYIDEQHGMALWWPNTGAAFPWHLEAVVNGKFETIDTPARFKKLSNIRATMTDRRAIYPAVEGKAVVWTRPLAWMAAHMLSMRGDHGLRVLAEVDDNYLSDKRLNVFMKKAGWEENDRDNHTRSICVGDGLIVSTEYLRDLYWKGLKELFGKDVLPEMFVCRNHVDERFIPTELAPPRADGSLRIGFMGSDSHWWDVDLIYPACEMAYQLGHEIVFIGINPLYSMTRPTIHDERVKGRWHNIEFTHIPWRNQDYRGTALPLDIGLAPLRIDNHTLGKSDIKWLEYTLSGAATVAQNCLVFNRTAVHGETALLASSPAEFAHWTLELIKRRELRERLVTNTRQYIEEERLLSRNTQEWKDAVLG